MPTRHKLPRPTQKSIDDASAYLSDVWEGAHTRWRTYDSYYHRTYKLWPTEKLQNNRPEYHPSTPTAIVDHAADAFMAFDPTIKRFPASASATAKEASDRVENALKLIMFDAFSKELSIPPKDTGRYLLHYGYAIARGPLINLRSKPDEPQREVFDDETEFDVRMAEFEADRRNWNPLRYSAPHPASVLMDPLESEPKFAIERKKFLAKDVHALTVVKKKLRVNADILDMKNRNPYDRVEIEEWWDDEWHTVKIRGAEILFEEWNPFGAPPFSHGFAGFGQSRMPNFIGGDGTSGGTGGASESHHFHARDMAVGLLESVMESIKMEAQRMTAHQNLLMRAAYAIYLTTLDPAELRNVMAQDGIAQFTEDLRDSMGIMPVPDVTSWMLEVGADISRDIENGTFVKALAGIREQGVSTVGQQVLLSTAAKQKFQAPAIRNQFIWTTQARRSLRTVMILDDMLGEGSITVDGHKLSAADIGHDDNVRLTFENLDPVLVQQAKITGMQEVAQGLKSDETYREVDARISDETKERDRLLGESILKDPFMHQVLARQKAEEMGLLEQFDEAQELRAQAEQDGRTDPRRDTGQPSANGAPGGGNNDFGNLFPDSVPPG